MDRFYTSDLYGWADVNSNAFKMYPEALKNYSRASLPAKADAPIGALKPSDLEPETRMLTQSSGKVTLSDVKRREGMAKELIYGPQGASDGSFQNAGNPPLAPRALAAFSKKPMVGRIGHDPNSCYIPDSLPGLGYSYVEAPGSIYGYATECPTMSIPPYSGPADLDTSRPNFTTVLQPKVPTFRNDFVERHGNRVLDAAIIRDKNLRESDTRPTPSAVSILDAATDTPEHGSTTERFFVHFSEPEMHLYGGLSGPVIDQLYGGWEYNPQPASNCTKNVYYEYY